MEERKHLIREDLQEKPHIPDSNVKHHKHFNPKTYISIQERVNSDPDFEQFYIDKLISEGWVRLESNKSVLSDELKGKHFKYRLNGTGKSDARKGTFRSGGIIMGINK